MLIELRISAAVQNLSEIQLQKAVVAAQQSMRSVCDRYREPVALENVQCMNFPQLLFTIRTLISHAEEEFLYNLETGEHFAFKARYSHVDISSMPGL